MTTITLPRAVVEQALEAMLNFPDDISDDMFESITALKAALARQAGATQEPHRDLRAALRVPGCERLREWVEIGPVQRAALETFAAELRRPAAVEAQRDALLEALIRCRNRFFPSDQPERDRDELWEPVNAAIKAVEGEKT